MGIPTISNLAANQFRRDLFPSEPPTYLSAVVLEEDDPLTPWRPDHEEEPPPVAPVGGVGLGLPGQLVLEAGLLEGLLDPDRVAGA